MKRIMRAFKMHEISAVDRPAQVHARMTIMKRAEPESPLDLDGLSNPLTDHGDNDMDLVAIQKMIEDALKASETGRLNAETLKADITKQINDAVTAARTAWEAELAKATDIAKTDEVVAFNGAEVRKSVVGEATFTVMKGLVEKDEINTFEKRAAAEIGRLPGTMLEKARALRAISKLGKEDADAISKMLAAGQQAMGDVLKSIGHSRPSADSADAEIETRVAAIVAEKGIKKHDAFAQFMATDEGKRLYTKSLQENVQRA